MHNPVVIVGRLSEQGAVDVSRKTPAGNPFRMRNESERDDVCEAYREWFDVQIDERNQKFLGYLDLLFGLAKIARRSHANLVLGCFCAPKRCHANTIATWLNNELEKTV